MAEAAAFSTSKSYAAGDYVLYEGILYRFTVSHSAGAWNAEQVVAVDDGIGTIVNAIVKATKELTDEISLYERAVFEPEQITGDRYKYVLTSEE